MLSWFFVWLMLLEIGYLSHCHATFFSFPFNSINICFIYLKTVHMLTIVRSSRIELSLISTLQSSLGLLTVFCLKVYFVFYQYKHPSFLLAPICTYNNMFSFPYTFSIFTSLLPTTVCPLVIKNSCLSYFQNTFTSSQCSPNSHPVQHQL